MNIRESVTRRASTGLMDCNSPERTPGPFAPAAKAYWVLRRETDGKYDEGGRFTYAQAKAKRYAEKPRKPVGMYRMKIMPSPLRARLEKAEAERDMWRQGCDAERERFKARGRDLDELDAVVASLRQQLAAEKAQRQDAIEVANMWRTKLDAEKARADEMTGKLEAAIAKGTSLENALHAEQRAHGETMADLIKQTKVQRAYVEARQTEVRNLTAANEKLARERDTMKQSFAYIAGEPDGAVTHFCDETRKMTHAWPMDWADRTNEPARVTCRLCLSLLEGDAWKKKYEDLEEKRASCCVEIRLEGRIAQIVDQFRAENVRLEAFRARVMGPTS